MKPCEKSLICTVNWAALTPSADVGYRACKECQCEVYEVHTPDQLALAAGLGRRVAIAPDSGLIDRIADSIHVLDWLDSCQIEVVQIRSTNPIPSDVMQTLVRRYPCLSDHLDTADLQHTLSNWYQLGEFEHEAALRLVDEFAALSPIQARRVPR